MRVPVNRQMMTRAEADSMAQSSPQPMSATEFAMSPAAMPIAPSMASQPRVSQEMSLTSRTSRAALTYLHANDERQRAIAETLSKLSARELKRRGPGQSGTHQARKHGKAS